MSRWAPARSMVSRACAYDWGENRVGVIHAEAARERTGLQVQRARRGGRRGISRSSRPKIVYALHVCNVALAIHVCCFSFLDFCDIFDVRRDRRPASSRPRRAGVSPAAPAAVAGGRRRVGFDVGWRPAVRGVAPRQSGCGVDSGQHPLALASATGMGGPQRSGRRS